MTQKKQLDYKALAKRQLKFIEAIEGIGDVFVFETKRRNKNQKIIEGLKKIEKILLSLFKLQKDNPDKFDRLLIAQDFFNLYQEDKKEAEFRLALDPEEYLISFSTVVNQILRIHEAAMEAGNEEISRFATYNLNWLLADISKIPKNDIFVEQLLRNLSEMTMKAIKKNDKSAYSSSVHWYIDIVFNHLRQKEGVFNLSYLEVFDKYFFSSIRYIISQNQASLFRSLISFLVDGVHIPSYYSGKVWDYGHLLLRSDLSKYEALNKEHKVDARIGELVNSEDAIDDKKKLDNWLNKFNELKMIIEPNVTSEQKEELEKIEDNIKEYAIGQFKYNNLLDIVFDTCAYCLFKNKPDYIKYLWEYNQPPDSDASWIGHDIMPKTINEVINFYFKKGLFERAERFWEDHHGSEIYYKRYFLLLLARALQSTKAEEVKAYNLPKLHVYRLSDLQHSIDGLVEIAKGLKNQSTLLENIGFNPTKITEIFDEKLIPFLAGLKTKAEERLIAIQREQKISPKKVDEFKKQFITSYNESVVVRDIFKYYNLYIDKSSEAYSGTLGRYGNSTVTDKAAFFEEWHVHYMDLGTSDGRHLASSENSYFLDKIEEHSKKVEGSNLDDVLTKFGDLSNVFILASNLSLYSFFERSQCFKPAWHKDVPQLNVNGFAGWYLHKDKYIPIFEVFNRKSNEQIVILDKTKLGKLIQYSPMDSKDNAECKTDIFYIRIKSFSEDETIMKEFLDKPPEWLKKYEGKQKEHLQEHVLLEIFERFDYEIDINFEGYIVKNKTSM